MGSLKELLSSACDLAVTLFAVGGFALACECRKRLGEVEQKSGQVEKQLREVAERDGKTGDPDGR